MHEEDATTKHELHRTGTDDLAEVDGRGTDVGGAARRAQAKGNGPGDDGANDRDAALDRDRDDAPDFTDLDSESDEDLDGFAGDGDDVELEDIEDEDDLGDDDAEVVDEVDEVVEVASITAPPAGGPGGPGGRGGKARAGGEGAGDSDVDDDDELVEDEVEASLDIILAERFRAKPSEDDGDELEEEDEDLPNHLATVIPVRQPDEFLCQSCFLLKPPGQLADRDHQLCRDCA